MADERLARIAELAEKVQQAVASPKNRARISAPPLAVFNLEEPIASARLWGYDANRYFDDPFFYVEQTLRQKLWRWEFFPEDDAPITLDLPAWPGHYPDYTYVGMQVACEARGVPQLQTDHPMTREPDLRLLKPVDFTTSGWMPRVLRFYDDLQRIVAGRLNVTFNMAWQRGCLDPAIQLRGYDNLVADVVERPMFLHDLLRFLVEQRCRWWEGYYRHFGASVGPAHVADDWINVPFISPGMFADFILPRYLEIEAFHGGITSVHSCGDQTPVQKYLLQIRSLPFLEVSPWTDLGRTLINVPPSKRLGISLHPNDVLCATPQEMEAKLRMITEACRGRTYGIVTSGLTPIWDDPQEFIRRIRTWTSLTHKVLDPLRNGN